jgi:hypothetical protein
MGGARVEGRGRDRKCTDGVIRVPFRDRRGDFGNGADAVGSEGRPKVGVIVLSILSNITTFYEGGTQGEAAGKGQCPPPRCQEGIG